MIFVWFEDRGDGRRTIFDEHEFEDVDAVLDDRREDAKDLGRMVFGYWVLNYVVVPGC